MCKPEENNDKEFNGSKKNYNSYKISSENNWINEIKPNNIIKT